MAEIKISIFIKLDQPPALSASLPPMKPNVALAAKPKASIKHTKVALWGPPYSMENIDMGR